MRVSMQIYFVTFVLVLFTVVGCKNAVPEISLLKTPSLKTSSILFDSYAPATNPTNSTSAISISTLNPQEFSAYKFALVSSLSTCESVDFSVLTALAPGDVFSFTAPGDGSFRVCGIGKEFTTSKWQEPSLASQSGVLEFDTVAPTGSFLINSGQSTTKNSTATLSLTQSGASEVYVTSTAGCASGGQWEAELSSVSWSLAVNNGANNIYLKFRDRAGNETSCLTRSIVHDDTAPNLAIGAPSTTTGNSSSAFSWPLSYGGADTVSLAASDITLVGAGAAGCSVALSGTGNSSRTVTVSGCAGNGSVGISVAQHTASDNAGNLAPSASSTQNVTVNNGALIVTLASAQSTGSATNVNPLTLQINFSAPVSDFKLSDLTITNGSATLSGNGTTYTAQITPSASGTVTAVVAAAAAHDSSSNPNVASDTVTWIYDGTPLLVTGLSDQSVWDNEIYWDWGCSRSGCVYRYVIDTSSSTTPTGNFSPTISESKFGSSGQYYIHVQARDSLGNLSPVKTVYAKIDNTDPSPGTVSFQVSPPPSALNSLNQSPVLVLSAGSDAHSLVEKTQARVVKANDTSIVLKDWHDLNTGSAVQGLALSNLNAYIVQVRWVDHAGNASSLVSSPSWTVDATPPNPPTSLAVGALVGGLNTTPKLTWTNSTDTGSGILRYQAALYRNSNSALVSDWATFTSGTNLHGVTLSEGETYQFRLRAIDLAGNVSPEATILWKASICPSNYVLVPASAYAAAFCIAKYEMKNEGGNAISAAAGYAWQAISRGLSRADSPTASAWGACAALGSKYDLISNSQWQGAARAIESVPANWFGGALGSGEINRGNVNSSSGSGSLGLDAPGGDSDGCYGTGVNCPGAWHTYKRTHKMPNGEVVWDFSGNVWEWVKDNVSDMSIDYIGNSGAHYDCASLSSNNRDKFCASQAGYGVHQGIGHLYNATGGAIMRGGRLTDGNLAGIYATNLGGADEWENPAQTGFRCVYNP